MKTVYVLVGPKGSGKSYIGQLLQKALGIKFIPIEKIFIQLQKDGITSSENLRSGYQAVADAVENEFLAGNAVSFEITVLTPASEQLLKNFEKQYKVEYIQIIAPLDICLERIAKRDQEAHIKISKDKITEINKLSVGQKLRQRLKIRNINITDKQIVKIFEKTFHL